MIGKEDLFLSLDFPLDNWLHMHKRMVGILLGIDAVNMVGYEQNNPHHCYDLMEHSLRTVSGVLARRDEVNATVDILKVAALYHDIGKPYVATEKEGRFVFYHHARKSAELVKQILPCQGFDKAEAALISFYIEHHDDFISYVLPDEPYDKENPYLVEISTDNIVNHIERNALHVPASSYGINIWKDLLILCEADVMAQSDNVYMGGKIIDTKAHKLKKLSEIERILHEL